VDGAAKRRREESTVEETRYYVVVIIGKYGADAIAGPFGSHAAAAAVCRGAREAPPGRAPGAPPPALTFEVVSDAQLRTARERGWLCRW
jgi:hypothetical protein